MEFTYIIPFKFSEDRLETLKKVISNVREMGCEIIIVDQGTESILPSKNILESEKYIWIHNLHPFNKSWALNCGWKESTNEKIVFGDADNLIENSIIIESLNDLDEFDFISPHIRLIDLNPVESKLMDSEIFKINRYGRGELDHQKLPMCGAITMFNKSSLEKIGGWPEEFFGWGAEDDAMTIKVKSLLKWKENDNNCYHLYHQRVNPDMGWYHRNLKIYNGYSSLTKENLINYIETTKELIGDKNRKFV